MFVKNLITIYAAALFCGSEGQLADFFFPTITKSVRSVAEEVANHPIVQFASNNAGNLLTRSVNYFSSLPTAIARSLGANFSPPLLASSSNVVDYTDNFVKEYTIGLGNEDIHLTIEELLTKYGYPSEKHQVVTDDGYVLAMFRIPGNGSTVFLMHGLLGSSDDFILAGPKSGLSYLLANEGYDVWMGNARGNKHSRRHTRYQPSNATFWDFSWHEIGCYDLPAMIDYVLEETGVESVKYIGHSQGTTSFFVMTSKKPEYNNKISVMVALSPVAFMSHAQSPIVRLLAPGGSLVKSVSEMIGVYEFLPDNAVMKSLKTVMCGYGPMAEIICSNTMFLIAGFGYAQLNVTNVPVVFGHMPAGASYKQFAHYGQGVLSGEFREFDYGSTKNLLRYNADVPPSYPLENVRAPVCLFYSDTDWLAHPKDVVKLYDRLSNVVDVYKVPFKQFNHLDFLLAKDYKTLIYERLRKLIRLY